MARAVLDAPRLARIVARRRAVLPFPIKGGRVHLSNNNPLLRSGYPGTLGIKTGYTRAAGRCLVAAARRAAGAWASSCCTPPTRAARRGSCSAAASRRAPLTLAAAREGHPGRGSGRPHRRSRRPVGARPQGASWSRSRGSESRKFASTQSAAASNCRADSASAISACWRTECPTLRGTAM